MRPFVDVVEYAPGLVGVDRLAAQVAGRETGADQVDRVDQAVDMDIEVGQVAVDTGIAVVLLLADPVADTVAGMAADTVGQAGDTGVGRFGMEPALVEGQPSFRLSWQWPSESA